MANKLFKSQFESANIAAFHPLCNQILTAPKKGYSLINRKNRKVWQVTNGGVTCDFTTVKKAKLYIAWVINKWDVEAKLVK